jgi:hypothetical protein
MNFLRRGWFSDCRPQPSPAADLAQLAALAEKVQLVRGVEVFAAGLA